jgi:hypothetical protein
VWAHRATPIQAECSAAVKSGGTLGVIGYFEQGGRSVLTRRDTFFHESVTSHQKTKTPMTQIAPKTITKANIFFTLWQ